MLWPPPSSLTPFPPGGIFLNFADSPYVMYHLKALSPVIHVMHLRYLLKSPEKWKQRFSHSMSSMTAIWCRRLQGPSFWGLSSSTFNMNSRTQMEKFPFTQFCSVCVCTRHCRNTKSLSTVKNEISTIQFFLF